jgi:hypothetical protein
MQAADGPVFFSKGSNDSMGYKFIYIENKPPAPLVLKDIGANLGWKSLTNSAAELVEDLMGDGKLPVGRRLYYFDSSNSLDEMVRDPITGDFERFAPGPKGPEALALLKKYRSCLLAYVDNGYDDENEAFISKKEAEQFLSELPKELSHEYGIHNRQ